MTTMGIAMSTGISMTSATWWRTICSCRRRCGGDILAVYDRIAQAESRVHGVPVENIHFHEVGTLDAVADITAVCLLIHTLAPEEILASRCGWAAARCGAPMGCCRFRPLPQRFCCGRRPFMPETWQGELCTPTGAALLTHFVTKFGPMPVMQVEKIGYGMGKKDFPAANCVRAMLGRREEEGDTVCQLECNLDDMTPEALGFAQERLWEAGALDVYGSHRDEKVPARSASGLPVPGGRRREAGRGNPPPHHHPGGPPNEPRPHSAPPQLPHRPDPWGPVTVKETPGGGKPEYEEAAAIARREGLTLREVQEAAMEQWRAVRIKP